MSSIIETCSQDTLMEFAEEQWGELTSLLDSLALLLPVDSQEIRYDAANYKAELLQGLVTIEPFVFESKSIRGIREKPGWLITTWKWTDETERSSSEYIQDQEEQTTVTDHAVILTMLHVWRSVMKDHIRTNHGKPDIEET